METITKSNKTILNNVTITLRGYYNSLPDSTHPKSEFIREIATKCDVTENTVRNWIQYGMKPNNPEHANILSEITGIPVDKLWNINNKSNE